MPPLFRSPRFYPSREHGFSLIEGLVSIALIAVLLILSVSAIAPVRNRLNSNQCINNLQQIAAAAQAYSAEHNNRIPFDYLGTSNIPLTHQALAPYLNLPTQNDEYRTSDIWLCPGEKTPNTNAFYAWNHYGVNRRLNLLRVTDVHRPSKTFYFADCRAPGGSSTTVAFNPTYLENETTRKRHGGLITVIFMDGHAESIPKVPPDTTGLEAFWYPAAP